ncbi:microsomal glutathione S-transferase 1 [Drosophila grimshawi]|uniref:Microsomal glutathione S-transferase 1 n=1 Tax=Drosophila grimshawi TaxID=7222 RepID=B4JMJ9_DROGR|nr:microsomal glutathione S-transferase 1 [Drosophila grimshawi]EDV91942.1 GH24640 [Drosophila grimshawi]
MDNETVDMMRDSGASGASLLSKSNPVFCCYLVWSTVLIIKMLLMTLLTARQRFKTKAVANPEDMRMTRADEVRFNDANVERVRRAHRNDLENILPFLLLTLAYVSCGPHPLAAKLLIRIGASARLLHTLVYAVFPMPQPTRAISFFITFSIMIYEAVYVLLCSVKYI